MQLLRETDLRALIFIQRALLKDGETCLNDVAETLAETLCLDGAAIYAAEPHCDDLLSFRRVGQSRNLSASPLADFIPETLNVAASRALSKGDRAEERAGDGVALFLPFRAQQDVLGCLLLCAPAARRDALLASPLIDAAIESLCDYAKRKRATETLLRSQSELINLRESALDAALAKSIFLASLSHEIRTPMNVMLGMSDLLLETPLSPEQLRYIETLRNAGASLLALLNDLIELSKIESGKIEINESAFSLASVLKSLAEAMSTKAKEKGLYLRATLAPDVPELLLGDANRIQQILHQLVDNAIKFTERGGVELAVELEAARAESATLRFKVKDTGIGIAEQKLSVIFERFVQGDSSSARKHGGTGLGLAICKRLVDLMGGAIWVESQPNEGSCFYVRLSLRVPAKPENAGQAFDGKFVLLAESDLANQNALKTYFGSKGLRAAFVATPDEAQRVLQDAKTKQQPCAAIFINCHLPEKDLAAMCEMLTQTAMHLHTAIVFYNARRQSDALRLERFPTAYLLNSAHLNEFDLTLQKLFAPPRAQSLASSSTPASPSATPMASKPLKILVVDDGHDNQLLIKAYFRKLPFELQMAENGRAALKLFQEREFDLVLMDLQMPDLDGYAATAAMREWEREHRATKTPIIALSAFALQEEKTRALDAGCDAYLTKPIKKDALLKAIYAHCSRYEENHRPH